MFSVALVIISFVTAMLSVLHEHGSKSLKRVYFGLTRLGFKLLIFAICGMVVGIAKEINGIRSENEQTQLLKQIHQQVTGDYWKQTSPWEVVHFTGFPGHELESKYYCWETHGVRGCSEFF